MRTGTSITGTATSRPDPVAGGLFRCVQGAPSFTALHDRCAIRKCSSDASSSRVGSRVPTLRDRLPEDLRHTPLGPESRALPFTQLYLIDDEWALEMANRTVHGVMHLGWVPDDAGGYRGQMAVLVKPNGAFGAAYMAAIAPFRHLLVYPRLMRENATPARHEA